MKIFTNEEWKYFCSKINWGSSFLDARAIRIMNKPFNQENLELEQNKIIIKEE